MSEFHNSDHEALAHRALDLTRVLEGEFPDTQNLDDATHWIEVYEELIGFKKSLLSRMAEGLDKLPGEAAKEVKNMDMEITRKQMQRYEIRLEFWQDKARVLAGERREASH